MNCDNLYYVSREKGDVVVSIMYNRSNGKYHYVNLSNNYICSCAFNTYDDALNDMNKKVYRGEIKGYRTLLPTEIGRILQLENCK